MPDQMQQPNQMPWSRPSVGGGQPPQILKKGQGQLGMTPYQPGLPGVYAPGPQAFSGNQSPWYVNAAQLSPQEQLPAGANASREVQLGRQMWRQVVPTSVNLRNQMLGQLFNAMDVPIEQMYATQGAERASGQRSQQLDQLRTVMAQRGLSQSGQMGEAQLGTEFGYLQGQAGAAMQARQMANQRQANLLQQLMSIPESDLRFWEAIRQGTIPAASLFQITQQDAAKNWGQAAEGIATAVKSLATMGAGGAAGGAGGAGIGGMTSGVGGSDFSGAGFTPGYGQSSFGSGTSAFNYGGGGMSFGGGMY